jgi:O-antigen/teichoic acid export membrane protein
VPDAPVTAAEAEAPRRGARSGKSDGLALALSAVVNSVAGFASWLIAARLMSQEQVGLASAAVTAFILVAGAAQLNLGVGLMRWLPGSGRHAPTLVIRASLVVIPLSATAGLSYALVVPELARTSAGTAGFGVGLVVFVLAAAGWGMFVVHDFVLVALGRSWWAPWRNLGFSAVRIALLVALGGTLGAQGVVLSWAIPIVLWIAVGTVAVLVLARRFACDHPGGRLPSRPEVTGFLAPTAVAQLGGVLLYNQVPLLVTLRFGAEPGAAFFIAWQAITVVDVAAMFFMNSLAVHVAREPQRAGELAAAARRRLLLLFLPALALGAVLAEPVLAVFGPGYAEAAGVLQLLLVGQAFRLVVAHELGVRQALGQALGYARLQLASTVAVLAIVAVLPVSGGGTSATLTPVAVGYVAVQVACAVAVLGLTTRTRRRSQQDQPA